MAATTTSQVDMVALVVLLTHTHMVMAAVVVVTEERLALRAALALVAM